MAAATATPPGILEAPPDSDINATLSLAAGGPPQSAAGEVSYPLGDTVDRIVYVLDPAMEPGVSAVLRVEVSCRFFGDRQFIVRINGASFTRHCGTTIEVPLQAQNGGGPAPGDIHLSAPGHGPTRVEWALTLSVVAVGQGSE